MSLFWAIPLTLLFVCVGTTLCFSLLQGAREVDSTVWILEHVVCPIVRIIVLMMIVSLVYPTLANQSTIEFWRMLAERDQFNNLLNILFIVGLGLAFVPLLSHPVIALPAQSMLTIALVFNWQFVEPGTAVSLLPSLLMLAKIFGYMLVAYLITRECSIFLSRWIDRRFALAGSIRLVSDAIYLVLQIPVILIYGSYLHGQLG